MSMRSLPRSPRLRTEVAMSAVFMGLTAHLGFEDLSILDESPAPVSIVGLVRRLVFLVVKMLTNLWLRSLGLPVPRVHSPSMYVVVRKAAEPQDDR